MTRMGHHFFFHKVQLGGGCIQDKNCWIIYWYSITIRSKKMREAVGFYKKMLQIQSGICSILVIVYMGTFKHVGGNSLFRL